MSGAHAIAHHVVRLVVNLCVVDLLVVFIFIFLLFANGTAGRIPRFCIRDTVRTTVAGPSTNSHGLKTRQADLPLRLEKLRKTLSVRINSLYHNSQYRWMVDDQMCTPSDPGFESEAVVRHYRRKKGYRGELGEREPWSKGGELLGSVQHGV